MCCFRRTRCRCTCLCACLSWCLWLSCGKGLIDQIMRSSRAPDAGPLAFTATAANASSSKPCASSDEALHRVISWSSTLCHSIILRFTDAAGNAGCPVPRAEHAQASRQPWLCRRCSCARGWRPLTRPCCNIRNCTADSSWAALKLPSSVCVRDTLQIFSM